MSSKAFPGAPGKFGQMSQQDLQVMLMTSAAGRLFPMARISRATAGKQLGKEMVKFNQMLKPVAVQSPGFGSGRAPVPTSVARAMGKTIRESPPGTFGGIERIVLNPALSGRGQLNPLGLKRSEVPGPEQRGRLDLEPSYLNPDTLLHEAVHGGQYFPAAFDEGLTEKQQELSMRARKQSDTAMDLIEKIGGYSGPNPEQARKLWEAIPTEKHAQFMSRWLLDRTKEGTTFTKPGYQKAFWKMFEYFVEDPSKLEGLIEEAEPGKGKFGTVRESLQPKDTGKSLAKELGLRYLGSESDHEWYSMEVMKDGELVETTIATPGVDREGLIQKMQKTKMLFEEGEK